jgi:hypothetical protein
MDITGIQILEIVGVISVVLSLLFVAYQIQRTNQIAIVTTEIETRNSFSSLNEAMYGNKDLAILIEKAQDPEFQPEPGELTQLRSLGFRFMNIWLASEVAFKNKMLPETSYSVVLNDIGYVIEAVPYMRQMFKLIIDNYPGWRDTEIARTIKAELEKY